MAIATQAVLRAALVQPQRFLFRKAVAGNITPSRYWVTDFAGGTGSGVDIPAAATPPTTPAVPTAVTAGAITSAVTSRPLRAPGGTNSLYLAKLSIRQQHVSASQLCPAFRIVDILSWQGGLSLSAAAVQTTNLPTAALTRGDVSGLNAELWFVCFSSSASAAAVTLTFSYTNATGTAGRTATLVSEASQFVNDQGNAFRVPLQAGDRGVQSVQSFQQAGSNGSAGNYGILLVRTLATVMCRGSFRRSVFGPEQLGLPFVDPNAHLSLFALGYSGNPLAGEIQVVEG